VADAATVGAAPEGDGDGAAVGDAAGVGEALAGVAVGVRRTGVTVAGAASAREDAPRAMNPERLSRRKKWRRWSMGSA
jgi:hypothetical protein